MLYEVITEGNHADGAKAVLFDVNGEYYKAFSSGLSPNSYNFV